MQDLHNTHFCNGDSLQSRLNMQSVNDKLCQWNSKWTCLLLHKHIWIELYCVLQVVCQCYQCYRKPWRPKEYLPEKSDSEICNYIRLHEATLHEGSQDSAVTWRLPKLWTKLSSSLVIAKNFWLQSPSFAELTKLAVSHSSTPSEPPTLTDRNTWRLPAWLSMEMLQFHLIISAHSMDKAILEINLWVHGGASH